VHPAERLSVSYRSGEERRFIDANMLVVEWVLAARTGLSEKPQPMACAKRMNKQIRFRLACQESHAIGIIVTLHMLFKRVHLVVTY
jgi:hypothetical protein